MNTPVPKPRRYMYRCRECLAVTAVDGSPIDRAARCACGGIPESLGYVRESYAGARLARDTVRCACDHRCTGATGPSCDCVCRGENHGTGAVVEVTVDAGGVPRLQSGALERVAAWHWTLAALEAIAHERFPMDDYLNHVRIASYDVWRATHRAKVELARLRMAKTWHGRTKAAERLAAEWLAPRMAACSRADDETAHYRASA